MKKFNLPNIPIKVIDNFFESPQLWRHFALKQEFYNDEISNFPGQYSKLLGELDTELFHSLAGRLIRHLPGFANFQLLETSFRLADASYGRGWIHHDDPKFNVAGLIYLNDAPPADSGTIIYSMQDHSDKSYQEYKFQEFSSLPEDRHTFDRYKEEQQSLFKKNMTIHNVFNRCALYSPLVWHSADRFFGSSKDDSRLTLNFFGRVV